MGFIEVRDWALGLVHHAVIDLLFGAVFCSCVLQQRCPLVRLLFSVNKSLEIKLMFVYISKTVTVKKSLLTIVTICDIIQLFQYYNAI